MKKTQEFSQFVSEIYDIDDWYATYNYEQNTKRIMDLIGDASDKSLLELASGTGSYLPTFSNYYKSVAGLELSSYMRDISLKKYPQFPVYLENMADFSINQSFDVITLLCGSITLLTQKTEADSLEDLSAMIRCCKNHLNSKGLIIIEAYDQPETIKEWMHSQHYTFEDKYVTYNTVKARKSSNFSTMTKHFLISSKDPKGKTEYIKEVYEAYLCTNKKLISLFKEQGFELKMQVPSFAVEGRDLLIFELH